MVHILLTEENSELVNKQFPIGDKLYQHLQDTLKNYKGDKTIDGYKRLNNLLQMKKGINYREMKRIKNFFDNYQGTPNSAEFILNGGEPMKFWVNSTLSHATQSIHDFKQAKKDGGMTNAFIKNHEKNRQTKPSKLTKAKIQTKNVNRNISNNELIKFE